MIMETTDKATGGECLTLKTLFKQCDLFKKKKEEISTLTQFSGFDPDVPNLHHSFISYLRYGVGRHNTNQNMHSVVVSWRLVVELIGV